MKIMVCSDDGTCCEIELRGTIKAIEDFHLNRLVDSSGAEHFFTREGIYEGSGNAQAREGE